MGSQETEVVVEVGVCIKCGVDTSTQHRILIAGNDSPVEIEPGKWYFLCNKCDLRNNK